ncbi:iron-sulfur cluster assembly accessory protein [Candidatus Woesearchaeota archaeon]|nr:iron-sulfur cluster assembly accessory protein [Candidatus Woesearchaeota archaeon]
MGHGRSAEDADAVVEKLNEAVEAARKEASNREAGGDGSLSLTVTKEAAEKVRDILSKEGDDVSGIRIAVIPGGCAGFEYEFSFEKKQQAEKKGQAENRGQSEDMDQADDFVIEEGGVKFFVDAASMDMLKGAKIDYIENLQASGFKISNPNAKTSCGCGHSFG